MKDESYTSTPSPLGPCGLLQGETLPSAVKLKN